MAVTVKFSGKVQEYSNEREFHMSLDELVDVSGLLHLLVNRFPGIERIRKHLFISINGSLVTRDTTIMDGDEVMLFFRSGGG